MTASVPPKKCQIASVAIGMGQITTPAGVVLDPMPMEKAVTWATAIDDLYNPPPPESDLIKLTVLLRGFGIPFEIVTGAEAIARIPLSSLPSFALVGDSPSVLRIETSEEVNSRVGGYRGFYNEYYFDSTGAFMKLCILE